MYKTVVLNILAFVLFEQKVRANQDWNGSSEWPHLCHAGQRQSPINISISGDSVEKLSRFTLQFFNFSIPVSKVRVRNTNYYIKIDLQEPPRFVLFQHELAPSQKTLFRLHELNFHWGNQRHNGTEHAFWGRRFDLEGQLMFFNTSYVSYDEAHDKSDGILAVAIYFEISDYSISNIPLHEVASLVQEPHSSQMYNGLLDLRMLIPTIGKYTFYKGSLTTPPCSESVTWVVMINRITISPKAMEAFWSVRKNEQGVLKNMAPNFRQPQVLNGRKQYFAKKYEVKFAN